MNMRDLASVAAAVLWLRSLNTVLLWEVDPLVAPQRKRTPANRKSARGRPREDLVSSSWTHGTVSVYDLQVGGSFAW